MNLTNFWLLGLKHPDPIVALPWNQITCTAWSFLKSCSYCPGNSLTMTLNCFAHKKLTSVASGFTTGVQWILIFIKSIRTQSVRIGHHSSTPTRCTTGVPQGSVLGLLLFATYTSQIATITHFLQVCHQQCADDTQLFIALNPSDHNVSRSPKSPKN